MTRKTITIRKLATIDERKTFDDIGMILFSSNCVNYDVHNNEYVVMDTNKTIQNEHVLTI